MTAKEYDIPAILALPIEAKGTQAVTIGQYLGESIGKFLITGGITGSFYSEWKKPVLTALVKGEVVSGTLQKSGDLYNISEDDARAVLAAIQTHLTSADYALLTLPEPIREWYVIDTEDDDTTGKRKLDYFLSGPHTEEEARKDKEKNWNSPGYKDTAIVVHISVPEGLNPTV